MIKICFLLAVGLMLCAAQVDQRTYANCETAGTEPCISNFAFGKSVGETLAANIQCAASASSLFVRDTEGYQILDPITLATISDQRLNCPYLLISRREYGGYYVVLQSTQSTLAADGSKCWCEGASGSCQIRVVHFNVSNGESLVTARPIIGNTKTSAIYHLQSDIVQAPVQIRDCKLNSTESAPFSTYEWAQPQGGDALIDYPRDIYSLCPVDIQSKAAQSVSTRGYRFIMTGGNAAGSYASVSRFFDANGVGSLNVDGEDYLWVQERLFAGLNVTWSAGPSYLSSVPAPATGDAPVGLGRIDAATGALIRNSSIVLTGEHILEEGDTGRSNFLWVTAANGDLFRVTSVDMTDPTNPITVSYEETIPFRMMNFTECYGTNVLGGGKWQDVDGGEWPLGCPTLDGRNYGFATAMSSAAIEAFRAVAFFQSGGETYVALGFPSTGIPCASCLPTTFLQQIMDIWQLSGVAQPQLVERIEAGAFKQPTGSTAVTFQDTFVSQQGLFFYTNVSAPGNVLHWFPISGSGSALADGLASYQTFVDASVPTDAITFDRYQPTPDTLVVNYWADGTVIYNVGPSGILSVNASYPSFDNPAAVSATSGAMESCFSPNGNFYRLNYNANPVGATGGAFFSVDLQLFQPFALNVTSLSTATSTSTTSTSTTSSSSSTSGGVLPSPSIAAASPSASASPGCLTPDSCKFECSKPDAPSKVPKPSVNPSKLPAPSKVPVQRVFTIELTYESTAADCGANAPDCCDVREWLGDDSVAASFFLCSADSTTKNRAPTYDSNDGTCTIFLAAQEGTDSGKITQAEFDAAVATLEGSFDVLCPTDVKNCDVSTQSGKTIAYVLGGSSLTLNVSLLLLLAAVFACLL